MSRAVSITEVSRHFSDYLNRVAYQGEEFLLLRGKKFVAELRPIPKGKRLGELPDLWQSLPHLSTKEADGLLKDLRLAKAQLRKRTIRDPWAS